VKVIMRGGGVGESRIARHLWRMCLALFFAAAFFFLGQQKVTPPFLRGSPVLVMLAVAPLALMVVWLVRVRLTKCGTWIFTRRAKPVSRAIAQF
jgi:hypothetical protein